MILIALDAKGHFVIQDGIDRMKKALATHRNKREVEHPKEMN